SSGGLVWRAEDGTVAAAARPQPISCGLPAHHRLVGAEAGGLRQLPPPSAPVSQQPVPAGLRPVPGSDPAAGGPPLPGDPGTGGEKRGSPGGGRPAPAAGERRGGGDAHQPRSLPRVSGTL